MASGDAREEENPEQAPRLAAPLPAKCHLSTRPRNAKRDASSLAIASVVNGLAAYGFIALGTRHLGVEAFAPIGVAWTLWAVSVATFTFPIQHWIIRTVHVQDEGTIRAAIPKLIGLSGALIAAAGVAVWMLRERLFQTPSPFWPLLTIVVAITAVAVGLVRGVLAGRGRFRAVASIIGLENVIRLVVAAGVVALGATASRYGASIAIGSLVILAWPSAWRFSGERHTPPPPLAGVLGGVAGAVLLAQLTLTSGPALVALLHGSPEDVTSFFTTLTVVRAPYLIALGLSVRLTGPLTSMVARRDHARLRTVLVAGTTLGVGFGMAAAAGGWWIGRPLIQALFGPGTAPASWVIGVLMAGGAMALVSLLFTLLSIARNAPTQLISVWVAAIASGTAVLLVAPWDAVETVAVAFLVTELIAFAGLSVSHGRWLVHEAA